MTTTILDSQIPPSPIHEKVEPVRAYAKMMMDLNDGTFSVIEIPEGTGAYLAGYRFITILSSELDYYLKNGARLA